MIVMKFGGSSVGSADAMRQVAGIVAQHRDRQPVVVVSAMKGVTNRLLNVVQAKLESDSADNMLEDLIESIFDQHRQIALEFEQENTPVVAAVAALLDEMSEVLEMPFVNEDGATIQTDQILAYGERLSAVLVAATLRCAGLKARAFDARGFMFTDNQYGSANVDFVRSYMAAESALASYVEDGGVPVVTGFIGSAPDGSTTTLGRGGSDYTATLLSAALKAEEVWLWKEVDGVLSTDPSVVAEAQRQPSITYDEAAELSHFGAKVLHPKTMIPVIELKIPIRIRNTFAPNEPGTVISIEAPEPPRGVRAVTAIRSLAMVTVEGKGMAGIAGFAAKVFGAAGDAGTNILMFSQSSSEQNICLVCSADGVYVLEQWLRQALRGDLSAKRVENIRVQTEVAAVAVVGEGMVGRIGVASKTFTAVAKAGVNVLAIAQGSSERNISFLVQAEVADVAIRAIHEAFGLGESPTQEADDELL